jgi:hypothetical protein
MWFAWNSGWCRRGELRRGGNAGRHHLSLLSPRHLGCAPPPMEIRALLPSAENDCTYGRAATHSRWGTPFREWTLPAGQNRPFLIPPPHTQQPQQNRGESEPLDRDSDPLVIPGDRALAAARAQPTHGGSRRTDRSRLQGWWESSRLSDRTGRTVNRVLVVLSVSAADESVTVPSRNGLPRNSGGSASTSSLSRPAQDSFALRPACLLISPRETLSLQLHRRALPHEMCRWLPSRTDNYSGGSFHPLVLCAFVAH